MNEFWIWIFGCACGVAGGFFLAGTMYAGKREDENSPLLLTIAMLRKELDEAYNKIRSLNTRCNELSSQILNQRNNDARNQ